MNILLDSEDRIKIGDFGLVTQERLNLDASILNSSFNSSHLTTDIGTAFYVCC